MNLVSILNEGEPMPPDEQPKEENHGVVERLRPKSKKMIDRLGEKLKPDIIWEALQRGRFGLIAGCLRAAVKRAQGGCFLLLYTKNKVQELAGPREQHKNFASATKLAIDRTNAWLDEYREKGHDPRMQKVSALRTVHVYEKRRYVMTAAYFTVNSDSLIKQTNTGFRIRTVGKPWERPPPVAFAAAA